MAPRAASHVECEARFLIRDSSTWTRVMRLRSLNGLVAMERRRERQRNIYFDTADFCLRRKGAALKLRIVGGRATLMLKRRLKRTGTVMRHRELAVTLPTLSADAALRRLHTIEPGRHALRLADGRPVRVVMTLVTDRRRRIMGKGRARIAFDVDEVALKHGRRVVRRRELEVENLTAPEGLYRNTLAALRRAFRSALQPSHVSKFEFGLRALRARRAKR